LHINIRVKI